MNSVTPKGYRFDDIARTETAVRIKYMLDNHLLENIDGGDDPKDVARHLRKAFLFAYDYGHRDHTQMSKKNDRGQVFRPEDMRSKRADYLDRVFKEFAKKYYTEDGSMSPELREDFPEAVKWLYKALVDKGPLAHSEFIVGALLVEIGRGEKARKVFPYGIDFSRAESITRKDKNLLAERASEAIYDRKTEVNTPPWEQPEHSCAEIGKEKLRFLSYTADGKSYLVTQSGGLVDKGIQTGKILKDMKGEGFDPDKVIVQPRVNGHSPPVLLTFVEREMSRLALIKDGEKAPRYHALEELKKRLETISTAKAIDGMASAECGMRLVCLDVDMLTGLRMDKQNNELTRFRKFLADKGIHEIADLIPEDNLLNHNEEKKRGSPAQIGKDIARTLRELQKDAPDDIKPLIDKALPNLCQHLPRIYDITDRAFVRENGNHELKPKQPAAGRLARLYITQGGMASAKTRLHDFARGELGKDARNLVVASLDESRPESDQYWLYLGAGQHDDDYKRIEQFGKAIRALTEKRARAGKFDFLMDGTGVPFEGRYDKIAHAFKKEGYETTVLAAARPLYVFSPEREVMKEHGIAYGEALLQARIRQGNKLRAAIPRLIVDTHAKFPVAANDAKRSHDVDRHITFDTSVPKGEEKIIAYTMDIEKHKNHHPLDALLGKENEALLQTIKNEGLLPEEWVKSKLLPDSGRLTNFKVIRNGGRDRYRIEIITDMEKYKGPAMLEKGLLNPQERGPDALYQHTLSFDILGRLQQRYRSGQLDHMLKVDYDGPTHTRTRNIPFLLSKDADTHTLGR